MTKQLLMILSVFIGTYSFCQTDEQDQTRKWIDEHNIMLNSPIGPEGFSHFIDCDSNHSYRRTFGDSIILYSRGGSISENLEKFKESVQSEDFNVTRYPTDIQKDGSVIMTVLEKQIFVWSNDTLYLWDDFNRTELADYMVVLKRYSNGEISLKEYKKEAEELSQKDYDFSPEFKPIYFKGVFDDNDSHSFHDSLDLNDERIFLTDKWEGNKKTYIAFTFESYRSQHFLLIEHEKALDIQSCAGGRVHLR